jgi:guanylate kinase
VDGVDYHFIGHDRFKVMIEAGEFLEWAQVFDHFYGTPRAQVEQALGAGRDVLFDIDWQGARQLEQTAYGDLVRVFVLPPSLAELERRLTTRAQDSHDVIKK